MRCGFDQECLLGENVRQLLKLSSVLFLMAPGALRLAMFDSVRFRCRQCFRALTDLESFFCNLVVVGLLGRKVIVPAGRFPNLNVVADSDQYDFILEAGLTK